MSSSAVTAPVFIVGTPRSGSTLLASLLGAHSGLYCGPETHAYSKFQLRFDAFDADWRTPAGWNRLLQVMQREGLNGTSLFSIFDVNLDELRAAFERDGLSARTLLECVVGTACRRQHKRRWIEKTPNHCLYLGRIRADFPTARLLWILRDPRDSAYSMRKLPTAPRSLIGRCRLVRNWLAHLPDWSPDVKVVRYEELVQDPRAVLADICAWIGEEYEEGMLQQGDRGRAVQAPGEWWKGDVGRAITTHGCGAWAHRATPRERDILEAFLTPTCEQLGYLVGEAERRPRRQVATLGHYERAGLEVLMHWASPSGVLIEENAAARRRENWRLEAELIRKGIQARLPWRRAGARLTAGGFL